MRLGASVASILSSPIKMVALTAGLGGVVLSAGGVFTVLNAQASNATAQSVTTGTLKMSLSGNGNGVDNTLAITAMKPGDIQNRYVVLTNDGTLAVSTLTLAITAGSSNVLSTDATRGLQIAINQCVGGTYAPLTGVCTGGTDTARLAATAVSALGTPQAITGLTSIAVSGTAQLKVSIQLPDSGECNVNSTANATFLANCTSAIVGDSVQGLTNTLTFKFAGTQPTAGTTNS